MNIYINQLNNHQFCVNLNKNFSIMAPAGVGKTRLIVARIMSFFKNKIYSVKLLVITYTEKSAKDIYNRVVKEMFDKQYLTFNDFVFLKKIYFGTIHSLCFNIIKDYGYLLNIKNHLSILHNHDYLWINFLNNNSNITFFLQNIWVQNLLKFVSVEKLSKLIFKIKYIIKDNVTSNIETFPPICSKEDIELINYTKSIHQKKFLTIKEDLINWIKFLDFNIFEKYKENTIFQQYFFHLFKPTYDWIERASLKAALLLKNEYQNFCLKNGYITYDDIIDIAKKIINNVKYKNNIKDHFKVILDEAQDTNPIQFDIIFSLLTINKSIKQGDFCMVGDPQQCIYLSEYSLSNYLNVHRSLVSQNIVQEQTLSVTIRCSKAIINFINNSFPFIFDNNNDNLQAQFIPLSAYKNSEIGEIEKWNIPQNYNPEKYEDKLYLESKLIINKILTMKLKDFNLSVWSDLAILCPRKNFLSIISEDLKKNNINFQIHSSNMDSPYHTMLKWIIALLSIIIDPLDSFEIYGVLKEIYGVSDSDLFDYYSEHKNNNTDDNIHPLNILELKNKITCKVSKYLNNLYQLKFNSFQLNLYDMVKYLINTINILDKINIIYNFDKNCEISIYQILKLTHKAEKKQLSLFSFLQYLKNELLNSNNNNDQINKNSIQLYTYHKAKGLEWKTVILPFLFAKINYPNEEYPKLFFNNLNLKNNIKIFNFPNIELKKYKLYNNLLWQKELQRISYVGLTRAKTKLIFINDECLFQDTVSKFSIGNTLQIKNNQKNRKIWLDINHSEINHILHNNNTIQKKSSNNNTQNNLNSFSFIKLNKSVKYNQSYIKGKAPSQLSNLEINSKINIKKNNNNLLYGQWWHLLMQHFPWEFNFKLSKSILKKHKTFYNILQSCPFLNRGKLEFAKFINSNFYNKFKVNKYQKESEVPFTYLFNKTIYSGYIDLLCTDKETNNIFIIDWKTEFNIFLIKKYKNQLELYKDAIINIKNKNFNIKGVYIYNTINAKLFNLH